MQKTYKWGIIGLGKIARKFANDLLQISHAELHAVASRTLEKAKAFADEYGATNFYGSYEEMILQGELDAVYIATPHVFHFENTLLCLQNKVAVLCEKPFAMNSDEVQQMIASAKANDTFLMEAFWTRFLPATLKVLEIIKEGKIGDVLSIKADFGFKAPTDTNGRLYNINLGGGSLLDIGLYPVFLALQILGKPDAVKAFAKLGDTKIDEECNMLFHYDAGHSAILNSSILYDTPTEAYIYGTNGMIHIPRRWHESDKFTLHLEGQSPQEISFEYNCKGYRYEAEEVMRCLSAGKKESDILPLSFSLDLMNLLDSIRKEINLVYPQDLNINSNRAS